MYINYLWIRYNYSHDITHQIHARLKGVLNTSHYTTIEFRNLVLFKMRYVTYIVRHQPIAENTFITNQRNPKRRFITRYLVLLTCICWITAKSNIHNPSREVATPAISKYADKRLLWTQIEPTQRRRKVHCIFKPQKHHKLMWGSKVPMKRDWHLKMSLEKEFDVLIYMLKFFYLRPDRPEPGSEC